MSDQLIGYWRFKSTAADKEIERLEAEVKHLEAINAELLEALRDLVEINRRDDTGDPELTATDRWRHEAWSNAYDIIAKAEEV